MASLRDLDVSLTVLNTDEAVQKVLYLALPQLRAEFEAQAQQRIDEAFLLLDRKIDQLRGAIEATDKSVQQAHMRINVLTNKATWLDGRMATHNNWLAEHRERLEELLNSTASLKQWSSEFAAKLLQHTERLNEVVRWQAGHEDEQDQVEKEGAFQLGDLRRRAKALEDIAVAHGQRLNLQGERQAKADDYAFDMAGRLATVERTLLAQIDASADLARASAKLCETVEQLQDFNDTTVDALADQGARLTDLEDSFAAHTAPAEPPPPQPTVRKLESELLSAYRAAQDQLSLKLLRGELPPNPFADFDAAAQAAASVFRIVSTFGGLPPPSKSTECDLYGHCDMCRSIGKPICCRCGARLR